MSIKTVRFRGRHSSVMAICCMVVGILSLICLPVLQLIAATSEGATVGMGFLGAGAGLLSLIACIASIDTMNRERDIYMWQPVAGMLLNGCSFVMWLIVFTLGAV